MRTLVVDKAVVERLLVQLEEYLRDLDEAKLRYSLEDFKGNKIIRRYTELTLQAAIGVCLDIASHIISYQGFREPLDSKDCFQVLLESKLLPVALTESLKRMAQFRNVVVHDYIRVNPEIVYSIVQENIPDILAFAQVINKMIR